MIKKILISVNTMLLISGCTASVCSPWDPRCKVQSNYSLNTKFDECKEACEICDKCLACTPCGEEKLNKRKKK
jgi:hypothetical protein